MKKSTGELSLVVVILLAIGLLSSVTLFLTTNTGNTIISQITNLLNSTTNQDKENNELKITERPNLSTSTSMSYKKEDTVENIIKTNIKTNTAFKLEENIQNNLKKETDKYLKKNKIKATNEYTYYESSGKNYIVNTIDKNTEKEYYIAYTTRKIPLLGTKYTVDKVIEKDEKASKESIKKIAANEQNSQFTIDKNYDESYISKALITNQKSFSNDENIINEIYKNNIDSIVVLNTYSNDIIVESATGFFLSPGIIATSWGFINDSLSSITDITAITSTKKTYKIDGIITINQETDLALLKLENEIGQPIELGDISEGDEIALLGSFSGFGISGKIGVNIKNADTQTNSLLISKTSIGSPLWNQNGKVIGMATSLSIEKEISNSLSANELSKYKQYYNKVSFKEIKVHSLNELGNKYYKYNIKEEIETPHIIESIWNQYKMIGNIEETMILPLVKASSIDNYISLRYKNETGIENDIIISNFTNELEKDNYKKMLDTNKKKIYKNSKYTITIYYEFNYIIIIIGDD